MSEAVDAAVASSVEEVEEEEVTLHVTRLVGQGLGISISGGKGSTPYKGNDEVSSNSCFFFKIYH